MNPIRRIFAGEDIREKLEGISSEEILSIVKSRPGTVKSSEFARAVGIHLAAEKSVVNSKRGRAYKSRKKRG